MSAGRHSAAAANSMTSLGRHVVPSVCEAVGDDDVDDDEDDDVGGGEGVKLCLTGTREQCWRKVVWGST